MKATRIVEQDEQQLVPSVSQLGQSSVPQAHSRPPTLRRGTATGLVYRGFTVVNTNFDDVTAANTAAMGIVDKLLKALEAKNLPMQMLPPINEDLQADNTPRWECKVSKHTGTKNGKPRTCKDRYFRSPLWKGGLDSNKKVVTTLQQLAATQQTGAGSGSA